MQASAFNYNITRPYPFRWFTPVVVVGGLILVGLLSAMNFVQNSYVLAVEYASNPNATIANGIWFRSWPSYLTNSVRPVYEPANIPVNSQFFTNQSALSYTVTSVFNGSEKASLASPSLTYYNNVFESCNVTQLEMQFKYFDLQQWALYSQSSWNIEVRAFATCAVWDPLGYTVFNLTAMYDPLTDSGEIPGSSDFISRSLKSKASFYWAEALLSAYWVDTVTTIWNMGDMAWVAGVVWLSPNKTINDISSLEFFDMRYNFFSTRDGEFHYGNMSSLEHNVNAGNDSAPQIWTQVDRLAKSMYSAVLADLGQTTATRGASLLNNENLLQAYTSNFSWIADNSNIWEPFYTPLETQDYNKRKSEGDTGPLEFSSSTISTKYLCQVPRLKSGGDIFVSVLLADLVLLTAAWHLYTLIVDWLFLRKHPSAKYCEGCLRKEDEIHLLPKVSPQPSPLPTPGVDRTSWTSTSAYQPVGSEPEATGQSFIDDRPPNVHRWRGS